MQNFNSYSYEVQRFFWILKQKFSKTFQNILQNGTIVLKISQKCKQFLIFFVLCKTMQKPAYLSNENAKNAKFFVNMMTFCWENFKIDDFDRD